MTGFVPSRRKSSIEAAKLAGLLLMGIWTMSHVGRAEEKPLLRHYETVGDAIPESLTGLKGDPTIGR
jgi:hypothetical protein